jgi:hypothetical protein
MHKTIRSIFLNKFIGLAFSAMFALAAHAAEVAGVNFEEKTSVGGSELALNGAGLRTKIVFKVYAIGLYVDQKSASASQILANKGPRRVQMVTLRELTADQLSEALIDGFHKNLNKADYDKMEPRIEALRTIMQSIGKAPEKTQIRIDYLPSSGTRLFVGGEQKGQDIAGEDFFAALLKIWIGDQPVQDSLRDALLGKKS